MHRIIRTKAYEAKHGPHFDDEHARKAVSKMENEDGSRGQHWSVEETSALANQYGIRFDSKFNKYDWYVALNMVYSDYYKVIVNMTGSNNSKYFVELAKAWLSDKDIDEGKMWYYYIYVMCDKLRDAESVITDSQIGLTISTDKQEIIGIIRNQYETYKQRKETIAKCDEEMAKCQSLLDKLGVGTEAPKEDPKISELQREVRELKSIIRKANQMVPEPMKNMLPQDMKDAMNKVDQ